MSRKLEYTTAADGGCSRIIREHKGQRTRHGKCFITEDHGGIAAVYPEAVHYQEEGEWKEIDNTLLADHEGEEPGFCNSASDLKVKFAKYTSSNQLVKIEKEGKNLTWSFMAAQRTRGIPGEFEVLSLKESKTLKEQTESEEEIKGESDKEIREETKAAGLSKAAENPDEITEADPAKAENPKEEIADLEEWNRQQMFVSGYRSAGRYPDIVEGVNLEYLLSGDVLKENIQLKTPEALETPLEFLFQSDELEFELTEEGGICIFAREEPEKIFYHLAPPCMYDAAGAYSDDVHYELHRENDRIRMTICPDREWMKAPERVLPVTVDPSTETSKSSKDIQDTFVREKQPSSSVVSTYGSFYVGNNDEHGKCRAFLKFNNLPDIPKGAIIYNAILYVWQYKFSSYKEKSFYITAHKVNGDWKSGSTTWNNQPSYDSTVLDYAKVEDVVSGNTVHITPKQFNITKLVRDWYNTGVNNGIMLKMRDESIRSEGAFVTSDYPSGNIYGITSDQFPSGVFYYRDAAGLEDYYSYHDHSAGRAGTGYVNDFNGNLVWIHEDTSTKGSLMPVDVSHVYNLCDCDKDGQCGKGWRLSVMRELKTTGIKDFPYVYVDGDGTSHYFYKDKDDGNKLKDEDGLGLKITQESSTNYDEYRIMEDKDEIKYAFGADGYLRKITDLLGNKQTMVYGPRSSGSGVYLEHITDGTGASIWFSYNSDQSRLQAIQDVRGRLISYSYDSAGHLTKISYPDGRESQFAYSGDQLASVTAADGFKISYSYVQDLRVPRVSMVSEYAGQELGQQLKISYRNGNTTIFEEPGLDGEISTTGDNPVMTYHFDNYGSPTDVIDDEGNASSYRYFAEGAKKHKLGKSGSMQRCIRNYLRNTGVDLPKKFGTTEGTTGKSSFVEWADAKNEFGDRWQIFKSTGNVSCNVTRDIHTGVLGNNSICIDQYTSNGEAGVYQSVELPAGTYTFSAYAKTKGIPDNQQSGANLFIRYDGASIGGEQWLTGDTDEAIDDGWTRIFVTFILDKTTTVQACAGIFGAAGHAWFDSFQLEGGTRANRFNLINDGTFRHGTSSTLEEWEMKNTDASDGKSSDAGRGTCAVLTGQPEKEKTLCQKIQVKGKSGDVFVFGCWAKADAVPGKTWQLGAEVLYSSGDSKKVYFDGNPYVSEWQYVGGIISTKDDTGKNRDYVELQICITYKDQMNSLKITDLQLLKDDGESYVYDDKGNLTSAESAAEKSSFSYNNKAQVSKMMDVSGSSFEYGYDPKNNLINARNSEGVQYNFDYDIKGNVIGLKAHGGSMTSAVTEGRVYYIRHRTSGKYLEAAGDSDGANVSQKTFTGNRNQKWKVLAVDGGYYKLALQEGSGTRVLDVDGASASAGANVRVNSDTSGDGQKFRIKPLQHNTYQILPKCGKDKTALDNDGGKMDDGANVRTAGSENEENTALMWYFEPVDVELGEDLLEDGSIIAIRN